ncbi:MAG TPA: mechanosensitive ion channel domain-containing protein [Verrucomicrobiae bacterium]|nr:mechanosensitive ion channel domain-containing protein [Verrucomicrobiae bacterium]
MELKNKLIDFLIINGPKVLAAVMILFAGYVAGRWVGKRLHRFLTGRGFEPPVCMLVTRLSFVGVLVLACLIAADNIGIRIMPLLAGAGVLGVGFGLATQGVLSNVVAGLIIIFTKPFRVGEYIDIIGQYGQVERIELMSTTLLHGDRSRVIIPNRKIVGEVMHNYGTIRQLDLKVGVSYDSSLPEVTATIREVLKNNPRVMKELTPGIGIAGLDDSCITMSVKPWTTVEDFGPAGTEIYQALVEKFRERKISIPFPQREIRVLNGNGQKVSG